MPADLLDDDELSPEQAAQVASLDAVRDSLVAEVKGWAARIEHCSALAARADKAGPQTRRTLALELAGSWKVSQFTAERWVGESERFYDTLPLTLAMMRCGTLLAHQVRKLLHGTDGSTPEVARAVEAQVLPAGAALCPSDLEREVKRARLRIESEQVDAAADAERQEAEKVAGRRTWVRPTEDGMAVAGALVTPEQGVTWAAGMDALERRERQADKAAGIDRTAEQRRADLFASLPALVLAGTAQDDAHRRQAGLPTGGRIGPPLPGDIALGGQTEPLFPDAPCLLPWSLLPEQVAAQMSMNLHVPVSTVLELSQEPGTLDRYGPVSAEHIRLVRPKSFRRIMVDAHSGRPIAIDDRPTPAADTADGRREQILAMLKPDVIVDADEPQHDPSARLARLIDVRDRICCGPGCSSSRTDREHLDPYPVGPTSARNLGLASPRCHSAKHHGWTLHRHDDGSVTWHSPLRRDYDRPGPWNPPPQVDLRGELPPPREPSTTPSQHDAQDDDVPLLDRLQPPKPKPEPPPPPRATWNDDPPF